MKNLSRVAVVSIFTFVGLFSVFSNAQETPGPQPIDFKSFAGTYSGTLKEVDGTTEVAQLILKAKEVAIPATEFTEASSGTVITATIKVCLQTTTCFTENSEEAREDVFDVLTGQNVSYVEAFKTLTISGNSPQDPSTNLVVDDAKLSGTLFTFSDQVYGTLTFSKNKRKAK